MCNAEPFPLNSVADSVLRNAQEQVSLPGTTDEQAGKMQAPDPPAFEWSHAEFVAYKAVEEFNDPPVGTSAQVPTSILAEADAITGGDRNKTYGPPRDNHSRTAAIWQAYISGLNGRPLDYRDICWMNVLQKASRDVFYRQRDNLRDGVGFLRNIEMADNDEGRA